MKATPDEAATATICTTCGADSFGCQIKTAMSGRRCCQTCTHDGQQPAQPVEPAHDGPTS